MPEPLAEIAASVVAVARWRDELELSANQAMAAILVASAGSVTAAELARLLCITSAAMTQVITRLEHRQLVFRQSDPLDARRLVIQPTKHLIRQLELLPRSRSAAAELGAAPARAAHS